MKAPELRDVLAATGLAALVGGVWFEFGPGYAGIIGGATLFALAIASAMRGTD